MVDQHCLCSTLDI